LAGATLQDKTAPAKPTSPNPSDSEKQLADEQVDRLSSGLIGGMHDFSSAGAEPRSLCTACHTPHLTASKSPLMDRRKRAAEPLQPYQSTRVELDSATLLCLSCHDGRIAPDVYSRAHATSLSQQLGASRLSSDRLASHPVGVKYPDGDAKYRPAAAVTAGGQVKLPAGRVQCTSCHDPHNTGGHEKFLISSNQRSRLCLTCHRL
jgi:predicted CXXCH cytochrome family protein